MNKTKYDYIHDELQEIAQDYTRLGNRLHSLKIHVMRLKDNKNYETELLEFDDPILEDVGHG